MNRLRGWEWLLFGTLLAASLALVFRFALLSRFGLLFGDPIDGLIETSILEHWWNVFRGFAAWDRTAYFYPAHRTLGYNDGYFLYGIVYAAFRAARLDPFLSAELVDAVVRLLGFVGFALFARRVLRVPAWMAALGAAAFTVSDNGYYQGAHAQLLSVAFAPIEATLMAALASALVCHHRHRAAITGMAAALLLAAWFLTSFYMAWFFVLFCAIWLPVLAVCAGRQHRNRFLAACWHGRLPLLLSAATLAVGLLPTARMYLSVLAGSGGHDFAETGNYLLPLAGALDFGADNLAWGWLVGRLHLLPANAELATGFTPLLLAAFVAALAGALARRWAVPASLGMAAVLCWLLIVKVAGWSAWWWVFAYVPGGAAIRVVARLQLFLDWPVVSVALAGMARLSAALPRHATAQAAAAILAVAVVAEQANGTRIPSLSRPAELAVLRGVAAPPASCRSFFTLNVASPDPGYGPDIRGMVQSAVDAMLIAEWLHLPTINGYASKLPPDLDLLYSDRPDYRDRVHRYGLAHALLPGLCSLDLRTGRWEDQPFAG